MCINQSDMKIKPALFVFLLIISTTGFSQQKIFNIISYGAIADGQTSNTSAIQKAIDDANANGGGTVLVPSGKFITGVIYLKSNVALQLDGNAELLATAKRIDYGPERASALITANNQHNISITGKGIINGQAVLLLKDIYRMLYEGTLHDDEWKTYNPWHQMRPEEKNRPKIIEFINCDSIKIKGITIKDGLCWVQNYKNCSNLVFDSITVQSTTYWNNDGIDLVDCKNAKVTNCFINAADDGICLKSEDRNKRCENIYVANCKIRSSASAVKLGTASWGGFKNISIKNIIVYDTYRSAIAIEAVDGGVTEDVDVKNIKATNTGNAVFIRLGHRNKDSVISKVEHIHISDVTVEVPKNKPDSGYETEGPVLKYPHNVFPSSVTGLPGNYVSDITLDNIEIIYEGGAKKQTAYFALDSLSKIKEAKADYPEFSMFGELPAWGFFVRHADGLTMKNITLKYKEDDFRTAVIFDDVKKLKMDDVQIPTVSSIPVIILNNVQEHALKNIKIPVDEKAGILIQNK
jgi:polygalacturonase